MIGEKKLKEETNRMKVLNKIDGLIGSQDVGRIIDFWNKKIDDQKEKDYAEEMNARNKYYLPLWKLAMEDLRSGLKPTSKKKDKEKSYIIEADTRFLDIKK